MKYELSKVVPSRVIAISIRVDEIGLEFGMGCQDCLGTVKSEYHEGSSIGIGYGAIASEDGGGEDAVLHGISYTWIDGVGISLIAFDVEVAVVVDKGLPCGFLPLTRTSPPISTI